MKTTEFIFNGRTLHLCSNGAALFDIYDRFGTEHDIPELIQGSSKESFTATVWILWKLIEQGELVRRWQGQTPEKIPTLPELTLLLRPVDVLNARNAIRQAVQLGFVREKIPEGEEIDLTLLKLQKKTAAASPVQNFFAWVRRLWASLFRRP